MGEGYGPVIVSRKYRSLEELRGKVVGTPGPLTTALRLAADTANRFRTVLRCMFSPYQWIDDDSTVRF